jgi:lipoprotein-anchoring transpeptidase ErfK/SrfK
VVALLAAGGLLLVGSRASTLSARPAVEGGSGSGPVPLRVLSVTPDGRSGPVAPSTTITVGLTTTLSAHSPMPVLAPPLPGSWSRLPTGQLAFVADGPLLPGTSETLTVPGGPAGLVGDRGQHLGATIATSFVVAPGSILRLQQLLAQLGYLPLSFTPTGPPPPPVGVADQQQGAFAWRWPNQPASLTALWNPGVENEITKGAVMDFESVHGLDTDGIAGPRVWTALLQAAATGAADPHPYGYVFVDQNLPQTATVYQNGAVAVTTPASTGVAAAPTAPGTYQVYLRYQVTTMSGTNPDGSKYVDPGIPWVSYFNGGDALHGFVRSSYGFPQSVGCVELPVASAAAVWPMTPVGTLVTVN